MTLVGALARLSKEYNLSDKKGKVAKISLGYLMSKGYWQNEFEQA